MFQGLDCLFALLAASLPNRFPKFTLNCSDVSSSKSGISCKSLVVFVHDNRTKIPTWRGAVVIAVLIISTSQVYRGIDRSNKRYSWLGISFLLRSRDNRIWDYVSSSAYCVSTCLVSNYRACDRATGRSGLHLVLQCLCWLFPLH